VIAGSRRNIFRYGLEELSDGGRALDGLGVLPDYQTQPNSECRQLLPQETVRRELSSEDERERAQTAS